MEIKVFSDLIDALEKMAKGAIELKNISRRQRDRYREAVVSSYQLLNAATNLIILRLGDILAKPNSTEFMEELRKLDNDKDWLAIERDVRLCANLRVAHQEMDGLLSRLISFRGRDWKNARDLVDRVLEREGTLADFISAQLRSLAATGRKGAILTAQHRAAKASVDQTREAVIAERLRLMRSELDFHHSLGRGAIAKASSPA